MKFRSSFITNSSSSSYTCEYCGETYSGWDLSLTEAEMVECVNGHILCETHLDKDLLDKVLESANEDEDVYEEDLRYEFPEKYCPFCTFKEISDKDIVKYLKKYKNLDIEELKNEIKNKFTSYSDFAQKISKK